MLDIEQKIFETVCKEKILETQLVFRRNMLLFKLILFSNFPTKYLDLTKSSAIVIDNFIRQLTIKRLLHG